MTAKKSFLRAKRPIKSCHLSLATFMHCLATKSLTRTELCEATGLSSNTVGAYLRAMHRKNMRSVVISGWQPLDFHLPGRKYIRLIPQFSLGIGDDAEIPAHLAHLPRSFALYD